MNQITIIKPDDWHIHLRDGEALKTTVKHASQQFNRAIVMPNLVPPITTVKLANAYRERIISNIPSHSSFDPLMTLYLTDNMTVEEIKLASLDPNIYAVKWYPAGATTNSEFGVTDIHKLEPVLDCMAENKLPLLIHGEVTDSEIDIFDREKVFIETYLKPIATQFPTLKIVLEHITTKDAVEFVSSASDNIGATITAHHLLFNRNQLLAGGIKPHYYCLPILKRKIHQQALLEAATSGYPKFFLGTDSAPHSIDKKETDCGCAGIYTAHAAIELYAQAFASFNKLEKLEYFASISGPNFYNLPVNTDRISLIEEPWVVPGNYPFGTSHLKPLFGNESLSWRINNT